MLGANNLGYECLSMTMNDGGWENSRVGVSVRRVGVGCSATQLRTAFRGEDACCEQLVGTNVCLK